MIKGLLHINERAVERAPLGEIVDEDGARVMRWQETLPNNVTYITQRLWQAARSTRPSLHRAGRHYFMMGDNRDSSRTAGC